MEQICTGSWNVAVQSPSKYKMVHYFNYFFKDRSLHSLCVWCILLSTINGLTENTDSPQLFWWDRCDGGVEFEGPCWVRPVGVFVPTSCLHIDTHQAETRWMPFAVRPPNYLSSLSLLLDVRSCFQYGAFTPVMVQLLSVSSEVPLSCVL